MHTSIFQWLSSRSRRLFNSIAFYPAVIAVLFLGLSIMMVYIDYSETGKKIKATWDLLRLRDASTARSIISAIAAGIISLTVFSFSMVMIVLNQAASQMSNRILDKLIGNRYQQLVLGFYIGTIVYSLFLLSTIRDIDSGIYVPSLSTYLLILLTVADIFLFIYFLHYITQSVKYEIIISRIHNQTKKSLEQTCSLNEEEPQTAEKIEGTTIKAPVSGIFSGFNKEGLLQVLRKKNARLAFQYPLGHYLLQNAPFLTVSAQDEDIEEWKDDLLVHIFISKEESIDENFHYGLQQLMEVAIKALSPGINDPGTATTSLHALVDLLAFRLQHFAKNTYYDTDGQLRLITREITIEDVLNRYLLPIWDYGKKDRMIQYHMHSALAQLQSIAQHPAVSRLFVKVNKQRTPEED